MLHNIMRGFTPFIFLLIFSACDRPSEEDVTARSCETTLNEEYETEKSSGVPKGGWGEGDQLGNANLLGPETTRRCGRIMAHPHAKMYEIGHSYSPTMPQAPFAAHQFAMDPGPSAALPFAAHVANDEYIHGSLGQQGTQFDALGHFGAMDQPWFPPEPAPFETASYYNGFMQAEVKPVPDSPLLKLGMENVPPIVTTAVVLDAQEWFERTLGPGEAITAEDIQDMIAADAQLADRGGILPGDAVYIRTGWGDGWNVDPMYYLQGPGLAVDAVELLAGQGVVLVGLDNPFSDPAVLCGGDICGTCDNGMCGVQPGTLPGLPFGVHHHALVAAGVHLIQNMNLKEIADDGVSLACTVVLPLSIEGASGSPIRPVAFGR